MGTSAIIAKHTGGNTSEEYLCLWRDGAWHQFD